MSPHDIAYGIQIRNAEVANPVRVDAIDQRLDQAGVAQKAARYTIHGRRKLLNPWITTLERLIIDYPACQLLREINSQTVFLFRPSSCEQPSRGASPVQLDPRRRTPRARMQALCQPLNCSVFSLVHFSCVISYASTVLYDCVFSVL